MDEFNWSRNQADFLDGILLAVAGIVAVGVFLVRESTTLILQLVFFALCVVVDAPSIPLRIDFPFLHKNKATTIFNALDQCRSFLRSFSTRYYLLTDCQTVELSYRRALNSVHRIYDLLCCFLWVHSLGKWQYTMLE